MKQMRKRHQQRPNHESPHEARLREIVDELVPDKGCRPEYLLFARELDLSLRHAPNPKLQTLNPKSRTAGPELQTENWKLGTATSRNRYVPDFSMRTKRVVAQWFRRGLHGRVMWRIGEALTGRALPGGR
jgi:hypothetical protein